MTSIDDGTRPEGRRPGVDRGSASPPKPKPWQVTSAWNMPDVAPDDPNDAARPLAALVSFHYLRAAVRRRWVRCTVPAVLGLLAAVGFLVLNPSLPTARTAFLLTHDPGVDPNAASATDVSLLTTQTVAQRTVKALGLNMSAQALLDSVTPVPTGSAEVLQLTMTGPSGAEAVRRLDMFAQQYLQFRAEQVAAQSNILIKGFNDRIAKLKNDFDATNKQIQVLAARGDSVTDSMSEAITQRSKLNGQIGDLEQQEQQAELQRSSIVLASKVIDPPAPVSTSRIKHTVVVLASGLIVGLASGLLLVIVQAILSDRLWLRLEVASALDTAVLLSVRRLAPPALVARTLGFVPALRRRAERTAADRHRMGDAIAQLAMLPRRRPALAVLSLDGSDEMRFGVAAAAVAAVRHGRSALVVDLTARGSVASALERLPDVVAADRPEVFRPSVVPSLTRGPADLVAAEWDEVALAKARNGVTLILADLDPAVGADHLTAWTDDVVIAVTAGQSSVELVRTAADLVRSVGLELNGAVLLRSVRDDLSSGSFTRGTSADDGREAPARPAARADKGAERSLLP
jgi:capsular polysaccharide biosynthesis protein